MITTQTSEKQTGAFSRIEQPFAPLSPEAIAKRVQARRVSPPIRNLLAGTPAFGIWGRLRAWFRGEI